MKKLSLMLLLIIIIQISIPVLTVVVETDFSLKSIAATSNGWKYTVNDDGTTATLESYSGFNQISEDGTLEIPSNIDGYTITKFERNYTGSAFTYKHLIKKIVFPDTITEIIGGICNECQTIEEVILPKNLEVIDGFAFYNSGIKNIHLPNSVIKIGNNSFKLCKNLETINIPSNARFELDPSDRSKTYNPFEKCPKLEISLDNNNPYYTYENGVLFNKDKTELIHYSGKNTNTTYTIPNTVEKIYDYAFNNSNLKTVYMQDNNRFITNVYGQPSFFDECENINQIIVSENNPYYKTENGILYNKNMDVLLYYPNAKTDPLYTVPDTIASLVVANSYGEKKFDNQYIQKIKIENNTKNFIGNSFKDLINLKQIEVKTGNTYYKSIDGVLYHDTTLLSYPRQKTGNSFTVPSTTTTIGEYAFYNNNNLTSVTLPNNLSAINKYAFCNAQKLENINIPDNIITIGNYAFNNVEGITQIFIPNSIKNIGTSAFENCINLEEISFEEGTLMETLGQYAFKNCKKLQSISFPEGVTNLSGRIDYCDNLKIIHIPSTVENIAQPGIIDKYTCPKIITIKNNDIILNGLIGSADCGIHIIRCSKNNSSVIDYADIRSEYHYNFIDLDENENKFQYSIINNKVAIENYIGDEENVVIPSSIEGLPVTQIKKCYGTFKTLTIPATVTDIDTNIAIYSMNLENINVDINNTAYISTDGILFNKNKTELLVYPMGKKDTFYKVLEGIEKITKNAFNGNMNLEEITIASTVNDIASNALKGNNLYRISAEAENTTFKSFDDILYKIGNNGTVALAVPRNITGDIELLYGTTAVGVEKFKYNNLLESVILATTVKTVGYRAFEQCDNLKYVVIPSTVTNIDIPNSGNLLIRGSGVIYCEKDSVAEQRAKFYNMPYEIMNVSDVRINKYPTKRSYMVDVEELDLTGGMLTIEYDNNISFDLAMTNEIIDVNGFNNSTIGEQTITLDYKGHRVSFNITVFSGQIETNFNTYSIIEKAGERYIESINPSTTIENMLENIETNGIIKIYKGTQEITNTHTKLATGMIVNISLNNLEESYIIVVTGDLNGDGEMGDIDALKLARYKAGLDTNLTGAYLEAGNVFRDSANADDKDLLKMVRVLVGLDSL